MNNNTITCPNCGESFEISEQSYATIVKQVRDREFENELEAMREATRNKLQLEHNREITELTKRYENDLKARDELVEYYRDFKTKMTNKEIGENLEQYCAEEFEKVRVMAFPNAYFDKDNDSKSGSKGDFIFREYDEEGVEIISIMFEMKNEFSTSKTKKKNTDYMRELDKDRREKNCEYAVLVSMLEVDSSYYNAGIVDASHHYQKMYVVRPQCFIPIISILRNAALNSQAYRREMEAIKRTEIDIENLESSIDDFKVDFGGTVCNAKNQFNNSIAAIDEAIKNLEAVKKELQTTGKHLNAAVNKANNLSVKKLCKNSPSLLNAFRAIDEA